MSEWQGCPGSERPGAYLRRLYEDGVWTLGEILTALAIYMAPWPVLHWLDRRVSWCWSDVVMLKFGYDPRDIWGGSMCFAWAEGCNPGHCYCGKKSCESDMLPKEQP